MIRRFLVACTLSVATAAPLAWAQSAPNGAKPDPQDAKSSVPQAIYRSTLADYRVFPDERVGSWKEANDNVGRIGGWRTYAKEAQQPESAGDSTSRTADQPVPADSAKPKQGGQAGHKMN